MCLPDQPPTSEKQIETIHLEREGWIYSTFNLLQKEIDSPKFMPIHWRSKGKKTRQIWYENVLYLGLRTKFFEEIVFSFLSPTALATYTRHSLFVTNLNKTCVDSNRWANSVCHNRAIQINRDASTDAPSWHSVLEWIQLIHSWVHWPVEFFRQSNSMCIIKQPLLCFRFVLYIVLEKKALQMQVNLRKIAILCQGHF